MSQLAVDRLIVESDEDLTTVAQGVRALVEAGHFRIELCGHLEHVDGLKGFTLDKTKYRMRFVDETDESVRVIIERKAASE